jgi:hypothetical protein
MTPNKPIEPSPGITFHLPLPANFQEARTVSPAPERPAVSPPQRTVLPLLSSPRSLLERSALFSGPALSLASESVDRLVGQGMEILSRPSTAALLLGGGILLRTGMVGAALAEGRVALAEGISLTRTSSLWRTGLAGGALLAAGCSSENSAARDSGGGLPEASPPPSYDAGSGTDGGVSSPAPVFQSPQILGTVPCGAGSMIPDIDVDAQGGLGVCANYTTGNHHLFRWDPSQSGSIQSIIPLPYPPDQVLRLSNGEIAISTYQNPGLSFVNETAGSESHAAFPTVTTGGTSSSGRGISGFQPRYPKGMVELGGQVYVATSNYDEVNEDYLPGTVLTYNSGTGSFSVLPTTGYNPTSVTPILHQGQQRLLVVESGAINRQGEALTESRVEIFDPLTKTWVYHLSLGKVGAGLSGEVAVSSDGHQVILPTGNNSGDLLIVDLAAQNVRTVRLKDQGVSSDRVLLTNAQLTEDGHYAFAGNFNDGRVYAVDLNQPQMSPTPLRVDTNTLDGEGISDTLRQGRDLFVGMGPQILRIGF